MGGLIVLGPPEAVVRTPLVALCVCLCLLAASGPAIADQQRAEPAAGPTLTPEQWPRIIDRPGEDGDRIVFTRVPGVEWEVDDQVVPFPDGRNTVAVPVPIREPTSEPEWVFSNGARVLARGQGRSTVVAPGAFTTMDLDPEWWVRTFRGTRTTDVVPGLVIDAYPRTLPPSAATGIAFTPFAGASGLVWGHMQWRLVTANANGRSVGPWLNFPTIPGARAGERVGFSGSRGRTYEFRARATDRGDTAASTVTDWSPPRPFAVAQDATTRAGSVHGSMRQVLLRGAFGGTLLRSTRVGGSWTSKAFYGTELALIFGVGPRGSSADVFIDGRHAGTVSTYDATAQQRQTRFLVRNLVPGRKHTVTVANRPRDARRTQLDLDAFTVTSTR